MVGAEGIEPSTSSASRKHSSTELRAYILLKLIYINDLVLECQYVSPPERLFQTLMASGNDVYCIRQRRAI